MKKLFKKVVALALAATMMIPVCGISAKAAGTTKTVYGVCDNPVDWGGGVSYYVGAEHDLDYSFDVDIPEGSVITSANLYIQKANNSSWPNWNTVMSVVCKNGETVKVKDIWNGVEDEENGRTVYADEYYNVSADVTKYIVEGKNYFSLTSNGVNLDYFSEVNAPTDQDKPRLVLTYEVPSYFNLTIDGKTYKAEKDAKVTVEETDVDNFAYWAKNGYIVSFDPVYSFYAYENVTELKAVHKDEAVDGYENISGLVYVTSAQNGDAGVDVVVEYWQKSEQWVGGYFGKTVHPGWGSRMVEAEKLVGKVGQYKVSVSNAVGNNLYVNLEAGGNKVNPDEALVLGKTYGSKAAQ